jgi:hypothetical protein
MKRGYYFVVTEDTDKDGKPFHNLVLSEGTFQNYGKLMVHRAAYKTGNPTAWRVSHIDSGACVSGDLTLEKARNLVKALQKFNDVWNLNTYDDLCDAINSGNLRMQMVKGVIADHR